MPAFSVPANLAFDDYAGLIAFLNDWLDRSDLDGSAPSMIALAESHMRRELAPLWDEATATVTTADGVGALPTNCNFLRMVTYEGNPLREVSPDEGRDYVTGTLPAAYSLEGAGLRVWPEGDFALTVTYQSGLVSLSEANTSNALLATFPDLYFYGAMLFASGYLADDNRMKLYSELWLTALSSAKRFFLRQRRKTMGLGRPRVVV